MTTPRKSKVRKKAHVETGWAVFNPSTGFNTVSCCRSDAEKNCVMEYERVVRVQIKELRGR